jgi:hypothetical protein
LVARIGGDCRPNFADIGLTTGHGGKGTFDLGLYLGGVLTEEVRQQPWHQSTAKPIRPPPGGPNIMPAAAEDAASSSAAP